MKKAAKYFFWIVGILSISILFFIQRAEISKYKEYKSKFNGSLLFIEQYRSGVDSILVQRADSIELLKVKIDSLLNNCD